MNAGSIGVGSHDPAARCAVCGELRYTLRQVVSVGTVVQRAWFSWCQECHERGDSAGLRIRVDEQALVAVVLSVEGDRVVLEVRTPGRLEEGAVVRLERVDARRGAP